MVRAALALVLVAAALGGCSRTYSCPTIGCQPQLRLTYRRTVAAPYHVAVTFGGQTSEADCPKTGGPQGLETGIKSCDEAGVLVTGIDLGQGSNETVNVTVAIDGAAPLSATARLEGIINSRDCDLICFDHRGTVEN